MDDSRTIFCGNLAKDVTEELLYELFLQAGPLERVNIPKDKQGNKRNFGFIVFKHDISVPYAIELMSGEKLFGQVLRLQPRNNNSAPSSPEIFNQHAALMLHQKTLSCPPNFPYAQRNNYASGNNRHGSGSNYHGDAPGSHQLILPQQPFSPISTPILGYPPFPNSPILQPNFNSSPAGYVRPDPFDPGMQNFFRPEIQHGNYNQSQNWQGSRRVRY